MILLRVNKVQSCPFEGTAPKSIVSLKVHLLHILCESVGCLKIVCVCVCLLTCTLWLGGTWQHHRSNECVPGTALGRVGHGPLYTTECHCPYLWPSTKSERQKMGNRQQKISEGEQQEYF